MASTGSFAYHLTPAFREIVGTTFRKWQGLYSSLTKVRTIDKSWEEVFSATGIQPAVSKPELTPIHFVDPLEGPKKRVTTNPYALGVAISRELWDDDLYKGKGSAIQRSASMLGEAFAETVEVLGHGVYNSGFTDNTYTPVRDTALAASTGFFDVQHVNLVTGAADTTMTNRSSSSTSLSQSALETGLLQFDQWTDDRGYKLRGNPQILLINPKNRYLAKVLLGAEYTPQRGLTKATTYTTPEAAPFQPMDPNTIRGALRIVESPWITVNSGLSWFIIGSGHRIEFYWRQRPVMDSFDDKNVKAAKFTIWGRCGVDGIDWFDTWGNYGA